MIAGAYNKAEATHVAQEGSNAIAIGLEESDS